jgi:exopolysaccharide biosynthesis polyprenyl glycosylphosphotransferase
MSIRQADMSLELGKSAKRVSRAVSHAEFHREAVDFWDWSARRVSQAVPHAELHQEDLGFWGWAAEQASRVAPRKLGGSLTLSERRWLLILGDLLAVNAALIVAGVIWHSFPLSLLPLLSSLKWFVTLSVVWLILGSALDVYDPARAASTTHSLLNGGVAALVAGVVYQLIPWFTPPPGRRLFFFSLIGFMVAGVAAWRAVYARVLFQPSFQRRVLIVGQDATARRLVADLQAAADAEGANPFRGTGYRAVGFVDKPPVGEPLALDPAHYLVRLIRTSNVDEILVAEGNGLSPALHEALLDCREMGIRVTPLSVAYERLTVRLPVEYAERDLSLIASEPDNPARRLYQIAKRFLDVMLALIGMLGMGVLIPFVALANALTSPGPLFYRQHRVMQGGRPFIMIKFRTMVTDAEKSCGVVWAAECDPRVTPIGRWLRRLRLDELPQVINVLRGEMSIVGPRPERPQLVREISEALPIYRARHSVRPGITGWAQIRYRYGDSVEDARVKLEYDLYYIKHAGLLQDISIILQTFPTMLKGEGH